MSKFKVGDKVKVIEPGGGCLRYTHGEVRPGDILEIIKIDYSTADSGTFDFVNSRINTYSFEDSWFELVEEAVPLKEKLEQMMQKVGVKIKDNAYELGKGFYVNTSINGNEIEFSDVFLFNDLEIDKMIITLMHIREQRKEN